jgi:hypothetical protein
MKTRQAKQFEMYQKIRFHGEALKRLFILPVNADAVKLSKQIFSLESKAHKMAEDYCNGIIEMAEAEKKEKAIIKRLSAIVGLDVKGIVFLNFDARGYALKLTEKESKESGFYYKDWGGYGILAPDFREN